MPFYTRHRRVLPTTSFVSSSVAGGCCAAGQRTYPTRIYPPDPPGSALDTPIYTSHTFAPANAGGARSFASVVTIEADDNTLTFASDRFASTRAAKRHAAELALDVL